MNDNDKRGRAVPRMLEVSAGNSFEDLVRHYKSGTLITHGTPRTITSGDVAAYNAIFGQRYAVTSDDEFARALGFPAAPVPWMLLFHMGFGKTVPDVSQLAVANLGYSDVQLLEPACPGDSLAAETKVIGYKENVEIDKASGERRPRGTGNIYVRSTVLRRKGVVRTPVLSFERVVMINKRERASRPDAELGLPPEVIPPFPDVVDREVCIAIAARLPDMTRANASPANTRLSGGARGFEHYEVGQRINHGERRLITSAHMALPNLSQNTARVHFAEGQVSMGSPVVASGIVYGGHVMSMADAQAYYGLENTVWMAAMNSGRHVLPCFEGESVAAWSEIRDKAEVPGRSDIGLLTVRTVAVKNAPAGGFEDKEAKGAYARGTALVTINGARHSVETGVVLDYERVLVVRRTLASGEQPS